MWPTSTTILRSNVVHLFRVVAEKTTETKIPTSCTMVKLLRETVFVLDSQELNFLDKVWKYECLLVDDAVGSEFDQPVTQFPAKFLK